LHRHTKSTKHFKRLAALFLDLSLSYISPFPSMAGFLVKDISLIAFLF